MSATLCDCLWSWVDGRPHVHTYDPFCRANHLYSLDYVIAELEAQARP